MYFSNLADTMNLKYIAGSYFVIILILQVSANCQNAHFIHSDKNESVKEVLSIYGENFETPKSREPYFITVHRCVTLCEGWHGWPYPKKHKEVEIVVPDLNNKTKFYKYVVHNHTSCGRCCADKPTMHKHFDSHEVDEAEYKKKLPNNPINLRNCNASSFCSKPQPRYKLNACHLSAIPEHRLILYCQCLPGCKATTKSVLLSTQMNSGSERKISIETHTACAPYRTKSIQRKHAHHFMRSPNCKGNKSIIDKD